MTTMTDESLNSCSSPKCQTDSQGQFTKKSSLTMGLEGYTVWALKVTLFFWKEAKIPKRWSLFPVTNLVQTTVRSSLDHVHSLLPASLPEIFPHWALILYSSYSTHCYILNMVIWSCHFPVKIYQPPTALKKQWHKAFTLCSQTFPRCPSTPLLSAPRTPPAHSSFNSAGSILEKSSPPTCCREKPILISCWNCFMTCFLLILLL